jgi:class 3 adenylate cyclase
MSSDNSSEYNQKSSPTQGSIQAELDRRVHHLKTLSDVSKELFSIIDTETLLRAFLLMTAGNFGIIKGFVLIQDPTTEKEERVHFAAIGLEGGEDAASAEAGKRFLGGWDGEDAVFGGENAAIGDENAAFGDETFEGFGFLPGTISCGVAFSVNENGRGLLGLGPKIVGEPYGEDDRDLLRTLINNLVLALRNAMAFEDIKRLNSEMKEKNEQLEKALADLDRRVYHLKTLYDVSKDIFGSVDIETILRNFLMMTMGNFGVMDAFILTFDAQSFALNNGAHIGYTDERMDSLKDAARGFLRGLQGRVDIASVSGALAEDVACAFRFPFTDESVGLLGLGPKLVGEPYSEEDQELLITLVNNLIIALKNAKSFEDIKRLNLELQEKNEQLEKTLKELQAALRKVEILESIKANLSKFVPTTVTRLIETSPKDTFEARERDVSVMFVDIEGYTALTERLGAAEVNNLVERYFSVFMDAIYENNGDVVETSGDGLMILYMSEDEKKNAMEAVRSALMVMEKTCSLEGACDSISDPLKINIGISSGSSVVGANKFECYTGSRWTYTCHGTTINVAARICSHAKGGEIMISKETADRVKDHYELVSQGKFALKNLSKKVEIYAITPEPNITEHGL